MAIMDYPFLIIGVTHMMALVSPGPDAALVVRNSTCLSPRQALWGALGLSCGILLHSIFALTGVSLLLEELPWAKGLVQLLGGSYLFWMGWQSVQEAARHKAEKQTEKTLEPYKETVWKTWLKGFGTNIMNPKALVYFISIMASVITPATSVLVKSLLGLEIFMLSLAWFSFLAFILATPVMQRKMLNARTSILYITGIVFLSAGGGILWVGFSSLFKLVS